MAAAVATLAAAAAAPGAVFAQSEPPAIEIIGVSPVPGLAIPRDRIPANVQTFRAADLDRAQATDLASFLGRRLGSVHLNEVQNNPFQPDVNFRGYTASPLLGTAQGLSLYMDGVRLNQPFGDVVSWDLIPKSAIASVTLNAGSNPLFGLNTLGGALAIQTKDGRRFAGTSAQVTAGSHGRVAAEFEHGGSVAGGPHWFVTGQLFHERGWRVDSPSDVGQLFAKVGQRFGGTDVTLNLSAADTDLNGNGLQESRLLAADHASVYTKPDNTRNRALLLNLGATHTLDERWSIGGNAYVRRIHTHTFNGDINDDSLDQAVYQPNAAEQQALTDAGFTGFPTAGESAGNTPFPKWRCIANALLNDEPAEKCNGLVNRSATRQSNAGLTLQLNHDGRIGTFAARSLLGAGLDTSRTRFIQSTELGYLNPDRSITGVGAFGDGVTGGTVDGAPFDTRVDLAGRSTTASVFGSSIVTLTEAVHLTLSGRYNRTTVRNRDAITPGGGPGSLDGDDTYARFNPAIGMTFNPAPGLNAWAGLAQGSRAPSSIELGCADPANPCKLPNAMAGDPPLRQVVATTFEAGVRGSAAGALAWSVGVFRSDNKDDLLFVADNAAGFGYFRNFGKTRRQGLELGASVQPVKGTTLGANYTFIDATYRSAEVLNGSSNSSNDANAAGFPGVEGTIDIEPGDRIPLIPRQLLKLFVDVDVSPALSFGAELNAVGSSLARGNENGRHQPDGVYYLGSGRNPGYAVVNVQASYRMTPGLRISGGIANLFDRRYSTAAQLGPAGFDAAGNFVARPFAADANGDRPLRHSTFYAPGAPRKFSISLGATF